MKKLFKLSLFLTSIFLLSLLSCEEDDVKNLEPSVPTILLPVDKAVDVDKQITFSWKTSIDPEKTMVKYTLYLGTTEKLIKDDIKVKDQTETEFNVDLAGHATYYWKVAATDAVGLVAETPVASFTTSNSAPTKPVGSVPAHEAIDVAKIMTFKWSASTDGDADAIKYDFYLGTSVTLSESDKKTSDLETTEFEVADMEARTQYFWKVCAKDAEGDIVCSDVFNFTTTNSKQSKPTAVFPVNAADNIARDITVEWAASVDEDGDIIVYDLFLANKKDYETNSKAFVPADLKSADLEVTTFDVTKLNALDTYYWKVVAKDAEGVGVESDVFSFTTTNSKRSKPTAISPIDAADNIARDITIEWTASVDEDGDKIVYDLFLVTKKDYETNSKAFVAADLKSADLEVTTFDVTKLNAPDTYYWKVISKDTKGVAVESDVFSFTTTNNEQSKPTAIFPIDAAGNIARDITIEWTASVDKDGDKIVYDLFLVNKNDYETNSKTFVASDLKSGDLEVTKFDITKLNAPDTYYWKVVAKDTEGAAVESDVFSFTTTNNEQSKPTAVFPIDAAGNIASDITIEWTASVDKDGDKIVYDLFLVNKNDYEANSKAFVTSDLKSGDLEVTKFDVTKLNAPDTYYWKVVAKDAEGVGVESDVFSFSTFNTAPTKSTLTFPADAAIDVEKDITFIWTESTDAEDQDIVYHLFYGTDINKFKPEHPTVNNLGKNEFAATSLKGHTEYFWQIESEDTAGAKTKSDVFSFTTLNEAPSKVVNTEIVDLIENGNKIGKKITWASAIDKDGDAIKYDFYLGKTNELTAAHIVGKDLKKTEYDALNLDGNSEYFWKIVAKDTQGAISESEVASFKTNNTVPSKASLTAPLNAATGITGSVTLTWAAATDAEGDAITYSVFLTRSDVFGSFPLKTGLSATELVYNNLKGNSTYKWKVVAKDAQGGESMSEVFSFITDNSIPTAAVLNSSVSEVINNDALDITISWAASTDADDEALVYDVYLSEDDTFDASDLKKENLEATEFTFVGLNFTTAYKVKVITKDEHGAKIESNIIDFTSMENQTAEVGTWTDTRDGKVYKTVTVDGNTWLAENFGFIPANMVDGDKQCSVYGIDNSEGRDAAIAHENYSKYGVLYSAYLLDDIAPEGWHVATDEDWQALELFSGVPENELEYNSSYYRGETVHKFQAIDGGWTNLTVPTNEIKFGAQAGGYYSISYKGIESYTYFWTNSTGPLLFGGEGYFYRAMSSKKIGINRRNNKGANSRMYVRLVKD